MKIVECVPNFSEGRDPQIIDQITGEIEQVEDVTLLDVDPGKDTNRTVVSFVGSPEGVVEAAFQAIDKAAEVIDMSTHSGAHARMGATDVCPFVPVSGVTMEDCVELSKQLGKRVGEELGIPVYLYEKSATKPERENLADIRKGEYEALPKKLKDPEFEPDFGPAEFNKKAGATVIGAREFLIAYNINLNTRRKKLAKEIALTIREKGRYKRDENRKIVRDKDGKKLRVPGKFEYCKAVGWYMEDFGRAQISMNLTNYKVSPPHKVFDECCKLAADLGVRVTGSELVGLIPLQALKEAGRYFLRKQGKTTGVPESELIHIAVLSMGLSDLYPFEKDKKIIEYQIKRKDSLVGMKGEDFIDLLSTDSPAPGGGSVAALCGSMSTALTSMVCALTHNKKGYRDKNEKMDETGAKAQELKEQFTADVDRDTDSFNKIMNAFKLPKKGEENKKIRKQAIQKATKEATMVPFGVLEQCKKSSELARIVVEEGNRNSISDAGVAALTARAAAEGAYLNVKINLQDIEDQDFKKKTLKEAEEIRKFVVEHTEETVKICEKLMNEEE
ncbi:MAG: glutamate formimidoyltransferase [bacterium]